MISIQRCARFLGLLLVGALAPIATAGPQWSKPQLVSPKDRPVSFPQVGLDAQGAATAIWMAGDGVPQTGPYVIRAATRGRSSKSWSLVADPLSDDDGSFNPGLAVGGNGSAIACWDTSAQKLTVAVRASGTAAFGAPVQLAAAGATTGNGARALALGVTGDGLIVWDNSGSVEGLRIRLINGGVLAGADSTVTGSGSTSTAQQLNIPDALATPSGVYVGFDKFRFITSPATYTPTLLGPASAGGFDAGRSFTSATTSSLYGTVIAPGPGGEIAGAWRTSNEIWAVLGSETPQKISAGTESISSQIGFAGGKDGSLVAAWIQSMPDGRYRVYGAVRPASAGAFEPPVELSEPSDVFFRGGPHVAFAGNTAFVVWSRDHGLFDRVEVASWRAASGFDEIAKTVSGRVDGDDGTASFPCIAANEDGYAMIVWAQTFKHEASGQLYSRVVATTYGYGPRDTKPPKVTGFKVTPERFATGPKFGAVVVKAGQNTVMFPELDIPAPLRAGTEFLFKTTEGGSYSIVIDGVGCSTFRKEGKKTTEDRTTADCEALDDTAGLQGKAKIGINRVKYLGEDLTPGGTYTATLTVTDPSGNVSPARTIEFHFDAKVP